MTKPELGVKRDCPQCGARFYDLNKEPAHCPKCDHEFIPEALLKPRKPRREDEPAEAGAAAKPTSEVSLAAAEKEQKAPASKRKPGLDDEGGEEEEDIEDLEDIDLDIDDDDDDTLLEDEDEDDDDMGGIVSGGGEDES
ncbi:MAG: TIGR02300 family protein [Bryobacterales bacterium]